MELVFQDYQKLAALALKIHKQHKTNTSLSDTVAEMALLKLFTSRAPGEGPFAAAPRTIVSSLLINPFSLGNNSVPAHAAAVSSLDPSECQEIEHVAPHNVMFFPVVEQTEAASGDIGRAQLSAAPDPMAAQKQITSVEPADASPAGGMQRGPTFSSEASVALNFNAAAVTCAGSSLPSAAQNHTQEQITSSKEPVKAVEPIIGPSCSDSGEQHQSASAQQLTQVPAAILSPPASAQENAVEQRAVERNAGHGIAAQPPVQATSVNVVQATVIIQEDTSFHTDAAGTRVLAHDGSVSTAQLTATGKVVHAPNTTQNVLLIAADAVADSSSKMHKGGAVQGNSTVPDRDCSPVEDSSRLACSVHLAAQPKHGIPESVTADDPDVVVAAFLSTLPAALDSTAVSEYDSAAPKIDGVNVKDVGQYGSAGLPESDKNGIVEGAKQLHSYHKNGGQTTAKANGGTSCIAKSAIGGPKSIAPGVDSVEGEPLEAGGQRAQSPDVQPAGDACTLLQPMPLEAKHRKRSTPTADRKVADVGEFQPQTQPGWRSRRKKRRVCYAD